MTDLPGDLDQFLSQQESRIDGLIEGTEKKIVWARPETKSRTAKSLVYFHGFSASRQETAPLADNIAADIGANLFYTRLTGHGSTGDALANASLPDWLTDAGEALTVGRKLGEKLIVVGVSTGATLALLLAARHQLPDTVAIVLVSPNFMPRNRLARLVYWPMGLKIAKLLQGRTYTMSVFNERHARYWTTTYPVEAAAEMMKLVKAACEADLESVRMPVLGLYSKRDRIVEPTETEKHFQRIGSPIKKLIEIRGVADPKRHVLAGDILSPTTTDTVQKMIVDFLRQLDD